MRLCVCVLVCLCACVFVCLCACVFVFLCVYYVFVSFVVDSRKLDSWKPGTFFTGGFLTALIQLPHARRQERSAGLFMYFTYYMSRGWLDAAPRRPNNYIFYL